MNILSALQIFRQKLYVMSVANSVLVETNKHTDSSFLLHKFVGCQNTFSANWKIFMTSLVIY